jgi:hypothetical protein
MVTITQKEGANALHTVLLKGQLHVFFDPGFFSKNTPPPPPPWGPDSRPKAISYMASYSPKKSCPQGNIQQNFS